MQKTEVQWEPEMSMIAGNDTATVIRQLVEIDRQLFERSPQEADAWVKYAMQYLYKNHHNNPMDSLSTDISSRESFEIELFARIKDSQRRAAYLMKPMGLEDATSNSAIGDRSSRQTEKHVAPNYDLGRKKQDDIAEYIILRQTIGQWSDLTEGIRWVSQHCKSKGKPLKEASLRRAVSRVNSRTNLDTGDARKKVEEFEKNFGIKME